MRHIARILAFLMISLVSLAATSRVLAFPPLPSSFYGTVKVNGENVPDGTLVRALIDGQVYAEVKSQTYQGDSVYTLDIPGDDSSTAVVEGGHEGDTVVFNVGGATTDQTGSWKSGTNIKLNLSIPAGALQATVTSPAGMPTQAASIKTQITSPTAAPENTSTGISLTLVIIGIVVGSIFLIILWQILKHKPKKLS